MKAKWVAEQYDWIADRWRVSNGQRTFICLSQEDAIFLCAVLNKTRVKK